MEGLGGTPGYTAPEQITENCQTPMIDVHGFGICLLRMFCDKMLANQLLYFPITELSLYNEAQQLFKNNTFLKIIKKMITSEPKARPDIKKANKTNEVIRAIKSVAHLEKSIDKW